MKDFDYYKKNNTSYDRVLKDIIDEVNTIKQTLLILCVGLTIYGIMGMILK